MKKTPISVRILSILLVISLLMAYLPIMAAAADSSASYDIVADPSTMDNWKNYFGPEFGNTSNAGGVWSDKSVFTSDTNPFPNLTVQNPDRNFLVALSALAANKSIVGYSTVPTDSVLILDISNSMVNAGAVDDLVAATNAAIHELLTLNNYNRVAVVLYSSSTNNDHDQNVNGEASTILLPLGRYSTTATQTTGGETVGKYLDHSSSYGGHSISLNNNVTIEGSSRKPTDQTIDVSGGTYIQSGIDTAKDILLSVTDTKIPEGQFQAGTTRMPVMVLMSDGAPTYGTTNIGNVGNYTTGSGSNSNPFVAFLTQLTAAYAKEAVKAHYGTDSEPLFYTLGLGVGNDSNAISVLNPNASTSTINGWWNTYRSSNAISSGNNRGTVAIRYNNSNYYVTKYNELHDPSNTKDLQNYSDGYYNADDAGELIEAFDAIVQQIIIQSLYYPTLAEDSLYDFGGYLTFIDDIGEYMDVVDIKGVQLGNSFFSGAELSRNFAAGSNGGSLGTPENPTALGDEFIWAIIDRFRLDERPEDYPTQASRAEAARELVNLAYQRGQLSYTSPTQFSNYIGSYQDADGKYISFYDEGFTETPANAKYKIKSYIMLGQVQDGLKDTDMMYVSIQVRTEIATGKTAVIFSIPASLIPVISYNVTIEGVDSLEDITPETNINMTIDSADPIRLIYELGLRSDIDALSVSQLTNLVANSATKNADGTYSFLTNRFDQEAFDENAAPSEAVNAVSYFEPSKMNERYYYTEDTTIYVKNGNSYSKYTGGQPNVNGEFYRAYTVFTMTSGTTSGSAKAETFYEQISSTALSAAKQSGSNWVIPEGTIHRVYTDAVANKSENLTNTLDHAFYPSIEQGSNYYYVDVILGNNGKVTLTPATGIALTKQVDDTLAGTNEEFTFNIVSGSALNGTYEVIHKDAGGNTITEGIKQVTFADGAATVRLKANETLYLLVPTGTYTITEVIVTGEDHYAVSGVSVNGTVTANVESATATVSSLQLTNVAFTNTYKLNEGFGSLHISKTVTGVAPSNTYLSGKAFTFTVTLTNPNGGVASKQFDATTPRGYVFTDANGQFTVSLGAGESVTIHDLPANTVATVTEQTSPGFTPDAATKNGTVLNGQTLSLGFTNNYSTTAVTPSITIDGSKLLEGRDWQSTDVFTFKLQKYSTSSNSFVDVSGATATVKGSDASKTFQIPYTQQFTAAGTHYYRVIEVNGGETINGVSYDSAVAYFTVTVTDDLTGALKVNVTTPAASSATVTGSGTAYNVNVGFKNVYAPTGSTSVTVKIDKDILDSSNSGLSLEGYEFGLYDSTGATLLTDTVKTDANGKASFTLFFGPNFAGQTLEYVIKEIVPAEPMDGMTYDVAPRKITVRITDNLDGTLSSSLDLGSNLLTADNELQFTNRYSANAATVEFAGSKVLNGRDMNAGEFQFQLFETDSTFDITNVNAKETVYNTSAAARASSNFGFAPLVYDQTGTHYYVIKEVKGDLGGVTYDAIKYEIIVNVLPDGENGGDTDGHLDTKVSIFAVTPSGRTAVVQNDTTHTGFNQFSFTNTYAASGKVEPDAAVTINKVIQDLSGSGHTFPLNGYVFGLYNEDGTAVKDASGNPITVTMDADGNVTLTLPEMTVSADGYQVGDTLVYHLKEIKSNVPGILENTQVYHIHLEIVDDLDGTVSAKTTIHEEGHYTTVNSATFTNVYDPADAVVEISGNKTLTGRDMAEGEFEFHLYATDDSFIVAANASPLLTANNAAAKAGEKSAFKFAGTNGELTFDKVGTYYFVVVEEHSGRTAHGVTHSDAVYHVTVTVKNDPASGKLTYTTAVTNAEGEDAAIEFVNQYNTKPADTNITISGTKTLNGRDWKDTDVFYFQLEQLVNGSWVKVGDAVSVNKDNKDFDLSLALPEQYYNVGIYSYRVVEVKGDITGVTYDANAVRFDVIVSDTGSVGILDLKVVSETASVVTGDSTTGWKVDADFTNTYTMPEEIQVVLDIIKTVKNVGKNTIGPEGFQFLLEDAATGDDIEILTSDADGLADYTLTFGYDDIGTHSYKLTEIDTNKENIQYSKAVYNIDITVSLTADNELVASIVCNDEEVENVVAAFENIYDNDPIPETGDGFDLMMWVALLIISGGALVCMTLPIARKKNNF